MVNDMKDINGCPVSDNFIWKAELIKTADFTKTIQRVEIYDKTNMKKSLWYIIADIQWAYRKDFYDRVIRDGFEIRKGIKRERNVHSARLAITYIRDYVERDRLITSIGFKNV
jgi:hypothetical protein